MKGLKWAQLALAVTVVLAGCKGFWDAPSDSGGGGSSSGVFYVMNQGTQEVAGFSFASGSSTPTAITSGTASLATTPTAIAIAPNGGYLYVSAGGIFVYSISSSGALTLLNSNQAISSDQPTAMAVDGSGTWLLESISGSGVLSAIPISTSTGLLDSTRSVQTAHLPNVILTQIAVSPANSTYSYVFVGMGAGGTQFIPFTANATASPFGTSGNIKVIHSAGADIAVAVDPANLLLYVGESVAVSGTQTGGLRVFTIGSNTMTEVSGSPYPSGGTGPSSILATANFVYVANKAVSGNGTVGNISGYPIVSTAGVYSLGTLINTINAGNGTVGLAEDSTGKYVLAVNGGGSPDLSTFTFDTTTQGKLVAGATIATGTDPVVATEIVAVP